MNRCKPISKPVGAILGLAVLAGIVLFGGCDSDTTDPLPEIETDVPFAPTRWETVQPPGDWFADIWGDGPDNVYAVGGSGLALHYDGVDWERLDLMADPQTWYFVQGTSDGVVYIGGADGTLLIGSGDSWESVTLGEGRDLKKFWCMEGAVAYASNWYGQTFERDGDEWIRHELTVAGFWGDADTGVFAIDGAGTFYHAEIGGEFVEAGSFRASGLKGLWGSAADNLFTANDTQLFRYDGSAWSLVAEHAEYSVWDLAVVGPEEVYAVGMNGSVMRFDGADWEAAAWPNDEGLGAIWAPLDGEAFIVGSEGSCYTGSWGDWRRMDNGVFTDFSSVWGDGEQAYAVGYRGQLAHLRDGEISRIQTPVGSDLYDVWGNAEDGWFVVGEGGVMLRGDGDDWQVTDCGTDSDLRAVWGFSDSDVYAGGRDGVLLHFDGGSWEPVDDLGDKIVVDIWGGDPDSVYFLLGSEIYHYDGDTLVLQQMDEIYALFGIRAPLHALHGTDDQNVLCVGGDFDAGYVFELQDGYWTAVWSGVDRDLIEVFTFGGGVDYALDRWGRFLANDGGIWYDRTPEDISFGAKALWGTAESGLYAVGYYGGVWRYVE